MTKSDFTALAQALALIRREIVEGLHPSERSAGEFVWIQCTAAVARACASRAPAFNQAKFLNECNRREER